MLQFQSPQWLLLLLLIPVYWTWYFIWYSPKRLVLSLSITPNQTFSSSVIYLSYLRFLPDIFFSAALLLMIVALARPVTLGEPITKNYMGRLLTLAIDVSASMETPDISPNRFAYTKKIINTLLEQKNTDLIGIVIFAQNAYQHLPPTADKQALRTVIERLEIESKFKEGTAIGNGIAVAVYQQERFRSRAKNIILLSDGVNNAGDFEPVAAATLAAYKGSKVHAIALGREKLEKIVNDSAHIIRTGFQPELLEKIAAQGKGAFIKVQDTIDENEVLRPLWYAIQNQKPDIPYTLYYKTEKQLYIEYLAYSAFCLLLGVIFQLVGFYNPLE
ncbi:MAG: VWA domain-containing protein [Bacteroidia bacterium]|nr:VWA domain-containing protein [Bacteroidia bacterium]MDW8158112.1 VWA domain-containing protein [Bacteroidia bacterium]